MTAGLISRLSWAIETLRQLRIVHADTHLNNIIVTRSNTTTDSIVSVIDFDAAFLNTRNLTRTETLMRLKQDFVPTPTWKAFTRRSLLTGNGHLVDGPALNHRLDVDQSGWKFSQQRFLPLHLVRDETCQAFRERVVQAVTLQAQAASVGISPGIHHVWVERGLVSGP